MTKNYIKPQVELTLLVATAAILGTSSVQQLHQENAGEDIQL